MEALNSENHRHIRFVGASCNPFKRFRWKSQFIYWIFPIRNEEPMKPPGLCVYINNIYQSMYGEKNMFHKMVRYENPRPGAPSKIYEYLLHFVRDLLRKSKNRFNHDVIWGQGSWRALNNISFHCVIKPRFFHRQIRKLYWSVEHVQCKLSTYHRIINSCSILASEKLNALREISNQTNWSSCNSFTIWYILLWNAIQTERNEKALPEPLDDTDVT